VDNDAVVLIKSDISILPCGTSIHKAGEYYATVSTAACQLGAIIAPINGEDRTRLRRLPTVGPTSAVTELKCVERTHCKVLATWCPRNSSDNVVQRGAAKQESTIRVPDLISTVLSTGQNRVVHE